MIFDCIFVLEITSSMYCLIMGFSKCFSSFDLCQKTTKKKRFTKQGGSFKREGPKKE